MWYRVSYTAKYLKKIVSSSNRIRDRGLFKNDSSYIKNNIIIKTRYLYSATRLYQFKYMFFLFYLLSLTVSKYKLANNVYIYNKEKAKK